MHVVGCGTICFFVSLLVACCTWVLRFCRSSLSNIGVVSMSSPNSILRLGWFSYVVSFCVVGVFVSIITLPK